MSNTFTRDKDLFTFQVNHNLTPNENHFIEGDNLEILNAIKDKITNKVKMIYIDPPYNTNRSFIYSDRVKTNKSNFLKDILPNNKQKNIHYYTDWCNMMNPLLEISKDLLTTDGVIFISISDYAQHYTRLLLDYIFGRENFIAQFVWKTKTSPKGMPPKTKVITNHEYVICYSKSNKFTFKGIERDLTNFHNPDNDPRGLYRLEPILSTTVKDKYTTITDPKTGRQITDKYAFSEKTLNKMIQENKLIFPKTNIKTVYQKRFLKDCKYTTVPIMSLLDTPTSEQGTNELKKLTKNKKVFDYPKPTKLIQLFIEQSTTNNDLILDYFAGSGTTGAATLLQNHKDKQNRKFIMIQQHETTKPNSPAHNIGLNTIFDIAVNRLNSVKQDNDDYNLHRLIRN